MRGRPTYKPTDSDRNTVKAMAINGTPHETICKCLGTDGISLKTMYRYFREELDTALTRANGAVAARAYQMALAGNPPAATFFWLKCKAGWREVERIEHTGVDGSPLLDLSQVHEFLRQTSDK